MVPAWPSGNKGSASVGPGLASRQQQQQSCYVGRLVDVAREPQMLAVQGMPWAAEWDGIHHSVLEVPTPAISLSTACCRTGLLPPATWQLSRRAAVCLDGVRPDARQVLHEMLPAPTGSGQNQSSRPGPHPGFVCFAGQWHTWMGSGGCSTIREQPSPATRIRAVRAGQRLGGARGSRGKQAAAAASSSTPTSSPSPGARPVSHARASNSANLRPTGTSAWGLSSQRAMHATQAGRPLGLALQRRAALSCTPSGHTRDSGLGVAS